jgi:hypothetical protein
LPIFRMYGRRSFTAIRIRPNLYIICLFRRRSESSRAGEPAQPWILEWSTRGWRRNGGCRQEWVRGHGAVSGRTRVKWVDATSGLAEPMVRRYYKGLEEYFRITPSRDISPYLCSWRSSSKSTLATANSQALPVQSHTPGSHSASHTTTQSSIQNPIKAQDLVSETSVSYNLLLTKWV